MLLGTATIAAFRSRWGIGDTSTWAVLLPGVPCPPSACPPSACPRWSRAERLGAWSQGCLQHYHSPQHCLQQRRQGDQARLRAGWAPRVSVSLSLAAPSPWGRQHPAPRAQASSGMLPPPLQTGHLHPGLLQARPWEKDTEAGITARTPTVPSARLGVLSTLGAPAGHHRDLSSTREAASVTCPSPFYPLGS